MPKCPSDGQCPLDVFLKGKSFTEGLKHRGAITFRESQALRVAKVYPFTFYLSFSGEQLDGKLTIERFLAFQSELQREILSLEFHRKSPDPQTGTWHIQLTHNDLVFTNFKKRWESLCLF